MPLPGCGSPAHDGRAPGQSGPESAQHRHVAWLEPAIRNRLIDGQRNGAGRGVAVSVQVGVDALARYFECIAGGVDDPDVRLMRDIQVHVGRSHSCRIQHILDRVVQNRDRPTKDRSAIHDHVVLTSLDEIGRWRQSTAAGIADELVGARAIRTHAVGENALVWFASGDQEGAGAVAKQRIGLDVVGIEDSRIAIAADHKAKVAGAAGDKCRSGDQGIHESSAGCLHIHGRANEFQLVLNDACRGWKRIVRSECADEQQVDVSRLDAGAVDAAIDRFNAEIAGGLMGKRVPALEDSRALDDPIRIEAEALEEMVVGDDRIRDVAAGGDDADAHQLAATWSRHAGTIMIMAMQHHNIQSPRAKEADAVRLKV